MDNKKTPTRPLDIKALALTGTGLSGLDHGAASAKDTMCIVQSAHAGLAVSVLLDNWFRVCHNSACKGIIGTMAWNCL